jgi:hypothetical protein
LEEAKKKKEALLLQATVWFFSIATCNLKDFDLDLFALALKIWGKLVAQRHRRHARIQGDFSSRARKI